MKLTDELFEKYKDTKQICTILNDEYVLLRKKMPIEDDKIDWYINSINTAKEDGINICSIIDYRFIDGTTSSFKNGTLNYTTGLFIEDKAIGNCYDSTTIFFNNILDEEKYLKKQQSYIEELEKRSKANVNVLEKLISDFISLESYGITPDPKPLNFFYDESIGYSIIDVIPYSSSYDNHEFFPTYIFYVVFGYGRPLLTSKDLPYLHVLPEDLKIRYQNAYKTLSAKIVSALRKKNINEKIIEDALIRAKDLYDNEIDVIKRGQLNDYIANKINEGRKL